MDDILAIFDCDEDWKWLIKELEMEFETLVEERSESMTYLVMVLERVKDGIEISMDSYIHRDN